jgi:hypothetical protein
MFVVLVWYVLQSPDQLDHSDTLRNVVLAAMIILGGSIPSFVLHLFGDKANFKFSSAGFSFFVGGGYALTIFALWWTKPKPEVFIQLVELHEKTADLAYDVDLTDSYAEGDSVTFEGIKKENSHKVFLKCRFDPDAKKATISFTVRAANIPYHGTLVVTRDAKPETIGRYTVGKKAL